jgi:pilus assembly protein Flp/PilA
MHIRQLRLKWRRGVRMLYAIDERGGNEPVSGEIDSIVESGSKRSANGRKRPLTRRDCCLTEERSLQMEMLLKGVKRFMQEEDGVTAIEYGLIAALIAVVIIASVGNVGNSLNNVFAYINTKLAAALTS